MPQSEGRVGTGRGTDRKTHPIRKSNHVKRKSRKVKNALSAETPGKPQGTSFPVPLGAKKRIPGPVPPDPPWLPGLAMDPFSSGVYLGVFGRGVDFFDHHQADPKRSETSFPARFRGISRPDRATWHDAASLQGLLGLLLGLLKGPLGLQKVNQSQPKSTQPG